MEKRFESYDWLKAIGSMLFLVAAILPWWSREYTGFELRKTGFGDWLGIIAAIAILAVGLLTVIVETESLPIPRWVLNPTWMLALVSVPAPAGAQTQAQPSQTSPQAPPAAPLPLGITGLLTPWLPCASPPASPRSGGHSPGGT